MKIPAKGMSRESVKGALEGARAQDFPWRSGKLYAYVFDGGAEVEAVGKEAYLAYLSENGLDPTTFPSLRTFENDLVDMARGHLGGDDAVVGNFTSGGTESIILAVKTARDHFRAAHPEVTGTLEFVLPETAHAAFYKAAHYLDVRAVSTPVDLETFRADVGAMRAALTPRTFLVVASACSYAHGVVDPVGAIAAMAKEAGILCHVDGCMGGFMLPYFRKLGTPVEDFDFRVPGVTSMSMDFHKYALCPKGASVVLYRSEALRRFQLFACSDWTGYTMLNSTIQSSKSGGPMAAAWAVLQFVGEEGYLRYAKGLCEARDAMVQGIGAIPGLRVLGKPEMSLVAFTSDELSVFSIADEMKERGWYVQPQLKHGKHKANLHVSINPSNVPHTPGFLSALAESVAAVRAAGGGPEAPVELAQQLAAQVEMDTTGEGLAMLVGSLAGGEGGELPGRMADTNALLNELPRKVQEKLLKAFLGQLLTPRGGA